MTKSIKAQKLFIRLYTNQRKKWMNMPKNFRQQPFWGKKFPLPKRVKIEVINAVTGEKTSAYAVDDSKRTLKKWLRLRNLRAQFEDMKLHPKSSWFNFPIEEFKDFPIIIKVDEAQFPYLIDHTGEKITFKNKTLISIFLKTSDNINYLSIINAKKELMKNWIAKHPVKAKKRKKPIKKK